MEHQSGQASEWVSYKVEVMLSRHIWSIERRQSVDLCVCFAGIAATRIAAASSIALALFAYAVASGL